ncbi:hypothetical protein KFK09_025681 [Dendrobium nobile]|uniref:Uncharacterized protein n=1 Tax=Dendrobium nobile TaxID=94219 RepID=A0A8T3A694_DENNO|nr:hypothetical protein KFK09_025681 [Dendrobium nobile]
MRRVYQVWKGNNRFFLGGRLIFGPDVRSMVLTIFLIIVPVLLFAVFVSQRLVNEFQHHLGELIVGIPVGFAFYVIFLLFLTSGRDPGIIPRSPHPPEPEDDQVSNLSCTASHGGLSSVPPFKDVNVNGVLVRSDGEIDGDIISRIQVGWLKWRNASGLLCDRNVALKLKGKFYKMVVRPAMLYGAECWPLKEKHNTKLSVAEMRMLRWMSGFTLRDRIRNEHIREKVGVLQ